METHKVPDWGFELWYRRTSDSSAGSKETPVRASFGSCGSSSFLDGFVLAGQHVVSEALRHADGRNSRLEYRERQGDEPQQHQLCTHTTHTHTQSLNCTAGTRPHVCGMIPGSPKILSMPIRFIDLCLGTALKWWKLHLLKLASNKEGMEFRDSPSLICSSVCSNCFCFDFLKYCTPTNETKPSSANFGGSIEL